MAISIYYEYKTARFMAPRHHQKSVSTLDEARSYVQAVRRHAIAAHVIIEYVEVRNGRDLVWVWSNE